MDYWGAKRYVGPPSQIIGGPGPPGPPSSYAYEYIHIRINSTSFNFFSAQSNSYNHTHKHTNFFTKRQATFEQRREKISLKLAHTLIVVFHSFVCIF